MFIGLKRKIDYGSFLFKFSSFKVPLKLNYFKLGTTNGPLFHLEY